MSNRRTVFAGLTMLLTQATAFSQAPAATDRSKAVLSTGEVTGRDVYVRSGPSLNHYEVCKVQLGDTVSIVGEQGDWFEILPPEGTFSLVSGEFVDTTDNQVGVINGANVRVRAGSSLNPNKYTVQTLMTKGEQVSILGANPDGFLRIKPPTGASLWINRQYVRRPGDAPAVVHGVAAPVGSATAKPSDETAAPISTPEVPTMPLVRTPGVPSPSGGAAPTPTAELKVPFTEPVRPTSTKELEVLDSAARSELSKPVVDRQWDELIRRFDAVASSGPDDVARKYASHRAAQLRDLQQVTQTVRDLRSLDHASTEQRQQFMAGRATFVSTLSSPPPRGVEVQGELRVSALYPPGSSPRRYRLLDPASPTPRTLGYVEIPADSVINVEQYIGKYVGVRASGTHLQTGGVNPIPVYVAEEIVLMTPPTSGGISVSPAAPMATPNAGTMTAQPPATSPVITVSAPASVVATEADKANPKAEGTTEKKDDVVPMITYSQP